LGSATSPLLPSFRETCIMGNLLRSGARAAGAWLSVLLRSGARAAGAWLSVSFCSRREALAGVALSPVCHVASLPTCQPVHWCVPAAYSSLPLLINLLTHATAGIPLIPRCFRSISAVASQRLKMNRHESTVSARATLSSACLTRRAPGSSM